LNELGEMWPIGTSPTNSMSAVSYGIDLNEHMRSAASYVDRIIKGAKPSDLPIQQPTKYTLLINLKSAKTLGLEIPPNVLALADEVIE
jgi:putative ABC transport system substrate-binding protein